MKKLLLFLVLISLMSCRGQNGFILEPSKGDRFSYFLNGDVWETEITYKSKFALQVFSDNHSMSVWIQNLSMSNEKFLNLRNYINSLPEFLVSGMTASYTEGKNDYKEESFTIYGCDGGNKEYIPLNSPPDIHCLMKKIREYYNK